LAKLLEGIRVFDLTVAAVGPWSTKLLGALGADVIRVERPGGDNLSSGVPPKINGTSVLHISANHNKRNIELDLKLESDRALALKIVEQCDVFVQNMRIGAAERLGMGYDEVAKVNPRIIYVAASAYGRTGPMARHGAIDPEIQAMCGWCSIMGREGGRGEMFRHLGHIDLTTSTYITQAVLQALLTRERTGKGQKIEVEMLRAAMAIQTTRLAEFLATGIAPKPLGSASPREVPHQAFLCQDQKYVAVGVVREEQWPRLCRALKLPDLIEDSRFNTNQNRVEHRAELIAILAQRFLSKPVAWWIIALTREKVPNAPLLTFDELRHHPQVQLNGAVVELDSRHWGKLWSDAIPWKFESTPAGPIRPAARHGEHTAQVLAEFGIARSGK
jgi:crotonobetainyl-CoA:carnitine CoA-transferase CaiB-like acyl-CoA transferase